MLAENRIVGLRLASIFALSLTLAGAVPAESPVADAAQRNDAESPVADAAQRNDAESVRTHLLLGGMMLNGALSRCFTSLILRTSSSFIASQPRP